ncbi:TP53 regulating kinase [Peltigera leucophlebia]|nr:TP53 regulating kinase [Peltigera leucophlebia]
MALISNIKHGKEKLARYYKQAKKLFRGISPAGLDTATISVNSLFSITGSPDGDRKPESNDQAKVSREIPNAPITITTNPVAVRAIAGAHVGDTEAVPDEGYDYDYWAWNELPPTPGESPSPPKPSTASTPELKGQEPTVDNGDDTLLAIASIGDSITRILESASDSSSFFTAAPTTTTSTPTATDSLSLNRAIWRPKLNPLLSSSSSSSSSSLSSPPRPKRFQRSPFFGKKIGVTPRVSRIPSVLGALDPEAPAFESPSSGPTMAGGFHNEPEGHSEDEESTSIEPREGGFETFGGENGGRPFTAILADQKIRRLQSM